MVVLLLKRHRQRIALIAAGVLAAAIGAGAALVVTRAAPSARTPAVAVALGESSCGTSRGWRVHAGPLALDVTSSAPGFSQVYLVDASGSVVAEDPSLQHGATHRIPTTLSAGTYTVRCVLTDATALASGPLRVSGTTPPAAAHKPIRSLAMVAPVKSYTTWVEGRLPELLSACRRLDADVARGHLGTAKRDWLTAHLAYERLGAAYNAFGDADGVIDGTADGLPGGTASNDWSGFFAIEHALWGGRSAAQVRPLTRGLVAAVARLKTDFPGDEIDPGDLPLRVHEILENAVQFQLTGADDYGSGTTLATAYANTQGTAEILLTLTPLLRQTDPALLQRSRAGLAALQRDLRAARTAGGQWTPVGELGVAARERLTGAAGSLLETLSQIPGALAPRNGA